MKLLIRDEVIMPIPANLANSVTLWSLGKSLFYYLTSSSTKSASEETPPVKTSYAPLWAKSAAKVKDKLSVENLYFLASTRFAFRHVTYKEDLQNNLRNEENAFFGDAVPLHTVFDQLEDQFSNDEVVLMRFEKVIKNFIRDSIILYDTNLYNYDDKWALDNKANVDSIENTAKSVQQALANNTLNKIYFVFYKNIGHYVKSEDLRGYRPGIEDYGYPLGRHGTRRIECDTAQQVLYLNKADRMLLSNCNIAKDLTSTMTEIFFAKFCRFVIAETKIHVKAGNTLSKPQKDFFSIVYRF